MAIIVDQMLSEVGLRKLTALAASSQNQLDFFFEADELLQNEDNLVKLVDPIVFSDDLVPGMPSIEVAKTIHKAMSHLDRASAASGRIWSYLGVYVFRSYMAARWPIDDKALERILKTRWIVTSNRRLSLMRQEISRLWWAANLTFDAQGTYDLASPYDHEYGATQWVVEIEDRIQGIFDRNFSFDRDILRALIRVVSEDKRSGQGKLIKAMVQEIVLESSFKDLNKFGEDLEPIMRQWKSRLD